MINCKNKLEEYVNNYPEQVYVNQNKFFNQVEYETSELGFAGLSVIVDHIPNSRGQYNQREEYMRDYIKLQNTYCECNLDINPDDEVYKLAEEIYNIVTKNKNDFFVAYNVFAEFIDDIKFNNKLLNKIGTNIRDEEFLEYIHNDDTRIIGGRVVPL